MLACLLGFPGKIASGLRRAALVLDPPAAKAKVPSEGFPYWKPVPEHTDFKDGEMVRGEIEISVTRHDNLYCEYRIVRAE